MSAPDTEWCDTEWLPMSSFPPAPLPFAIEVLIKGEDRTWVGVLYEGGVPDMRVRMVGWRKRA